LRVLLLCFPIGFDRLFCKIQLALPAVQVCFACGLLCLCWLFAVALWSVRSIFVCGLLWRWLWLLWTLADKSYRPVQLTFVAGLVCPCVVWSDMLWLVSVNVFLLIIDKIFRIFYIYVDNMLI
jgi:hypothetical protein